MDAWPIVVPAMLAGAGVYSWAAVHPRAQLFGPTVRETGNARSIALTFDDGPNPAVTPALLRLLEAHRARASFFLIGQFAREAPALVREIAGLGHSLGNHTHTHANLMWLSPARIREELGRCGDEIGKSTGAKTGWVRPPWGYRGPQLARVVREGGFGQVAMWSRSARDWRAQPAAPVIERLRRVRGGDIVLLHDGDWRSRRGDRGHVVEALEYWLPRWRDAGLEFVALNEIGRQGGKGETP